MKTPVMLVKRNYCYRKNHKHMLLYNSTFNQSVLFTSELQSFIL